MIERQQKKIQNVDRKKMYRKCAQKFDLRNSSWFEEVDTNIDRGSHRNLFEIVQSIVMNQNSKLRKKELYGFAMRF